jgi:hypothetical protein
MKVASRRTDPTRKPRRIIYWPGRNVPYLLHSLSAMTETAFYLNPGLFDQAINLEDWGTR